MRHGTLRRGGALRVLLAAAVIASTAACDAPATGGVPESVPVLGLSEPLLEIGVVDGADEYIFGAIESVVRLGDGSIGVSDAGASRITVYDEDGAFVRRWGRKGDGPEEFASLSRIYPLGADSVMAAERYEGDVSVFDLGGSLGRQLPAVELSGDTVFALDTWLYGRFWVDGALTSDARARVRETLDRLPAPRVPPGYRAVLVAQDGDLWIREPAGGGAPTLTWTSVGADAAPTASIALPAPFRPTFVEGDELLGVWTGEGDVHFVRAYRVDSTGSTTPTPEWLRTDGSATTAVVRPDDTELMEMMTGAIRSMASAQEIHYSSNMTYTSAIESLEEFEEPEGLVVDFIGANARGWTAVFTHPTVDRVCGLAYGFNIPPGWTPGMVTCGPEASGATAGG